MYQNSKLIFLLVFLSYCATIGNTTEFVPVFMWETQDSIQSSPALQRISESSFKDILTEKIKNNPRIVLFAEETLSPEDFAQHDEHGKTLFPNLHKLLGKTNVAYKPYVQNPIGAIKQLGKELTEISLASLLRNFNVPNDEVLIVDLDDAGDDERRSDMLKRHDAAISTIFEKLKDGEGNILAMYTAHHTSWITPEGTKRNARSLLQDNNEVGDQNKAAENEPKKPEGKLKDDKAGKLIVDDKHLLLHVTSSPLLTLDGAASIKPIELKSESCKDENDEINCVLTGAGQTFDLTVNIEKDGYWKLSDVVSDGAKANFSEIVVPLNFSYHCLNVEFRFTEKKTLILPGLQIQPFTNENDKGHSFDDPYDCIGFTSIPIWTGMLVTLLLLLILTIGVTFMMDIKTMDKFDDAKGKTITINVSD